MFLHRDEIIESVIGKSNMYKNCGLPSPQQMADNSQLYKTPEFSCLTPLQIYL